MAAVLILLLALGALSAATPVPNFDAEVIAKRSAADDVASKVVGIEQSVLNSSHVACTASAIPYDMYYIRSSSTGKYLSFQSDWTISSDAASPYVWSIAAINNADNEGTVDGTTTVVASCQGVRRTIEAPGHNFCMCAENAQGMRLTPRREHKVGQCNPSRALGSHVQLLSATCSILEDSL